MQNLDVMDIDGDFTYILIKCHICKIHVKSSARAARSLAMHVIKSHTESHLRKIAGENHIQGHIHAESQGKYSHLKSHRNHIRNHIHAESIHFQGTTLPAWRGARFDSQPGACLPPPRQQAGRPASQPGRPASPGARASRQCLVTRLDGVAAVLAAVLAAAAAVWWRRAAAAGSECCWGHAWETSHPFPCV